MHSLVVNRYFALIEVVQIILILEKSYSDLLVGEAQAVVGLASDDQYAFLSAQRQYVGQS